MLAKDKSPMDSTCPPTPQGCPHLFRLKPQSNLDSPVLETVLQFCPVFSGVYRSGNTFPQFNRDGNHFTQGFVLGIDRHYNEQNGSFELEGFKKRVQRAECSQSELYFPQPGRVCQYCNNCRANFDDYMTHINSQGHLEKVQKSRATAYINDLCTHFPQVLMRKTRSNQKRNAVEKNPHICDREKVIYEGSTLATKKQNKEEVVETGHKQTLARKKPICKLTARKLSLRNYQAK